MILDVFPSYKDKDMVDLLYQFERTTGSSLNILVEKYLEKLLYEKGYLTVELEENETKHSTTHKSSQFEKISCSKGYVSIRCGDLVFSDSKLENADDLIEKLSNLPYEKLEEISKNNWDLENGQYSVFLKWKLDNLDASLEEYLSRKRYHICNRKNNAWQITLDSGFSICSGKNPDEKETITNYLYGLSDEELVELERELSSCKNRRETILNKINGGK